MPSNLINGKRATCALCFKPVPANAGVVHGTRRSGLQTTHRAGQCAQIQS